MERTKHCKDCKWRKVRRGCVNPALLREWGDWTSAIYVTGRDRVCRYFEDKNGSDKE